MTYEVARVWVHKLQKYIFKGIKELTGGYYYNLKVIYLFET